MPKTTEDTINNSIQQILELTETEKGLEAQYSYVGYVFSILFNIQENNLLKLEEKKQYLLDEIPDLKLGKKTWKIFTEAIEGIDRLKEIIEKGDISQKTILKKLLEPKISELAKEVQKIKVLMDQEKKNQLGTKEKSQQTKKRPHDELRERSEDDAPTSPGPPSKIARKVHFAESVSSDQQQRNKS